MGTDDIGKLYPVAKAVLEPLFRAGWRFDIQGMENIPAQGGAILCPNHTSVLDSFFVPALLPRRVTYVGKAEYMDSWKTRKLFPALGMIPIDRTGGDAAERALATAQRVLERGELFGIYPEGTRSRDGRLYRGKTGPARLALRAHVPIIPIGIVGTRDVMPPDARFPKLRKPITIRIGKPIDISRYTDRASDHLLLRQITDEVMYEIRQLSGQEYIDEYASRKPAEAEADPVTIDIRADRTAAEPFGVPVAGGAGGAPDDADVSAAAHRNGSSRPPGRNGGERHTTTRADSHEVEFVKATRPRSSAELLRNPPRRAQFAKTDHQ